MGYQDGVLLIGQEYIDPLLYINWLINQVY